MPKKQFSMQQEKNVDLLCVSCKRLMFNMLLPKHNSNQKSDFLQT